MKKIIALIMASMMTFGMVACDGEAEDTSLDTTIEVEVTEDDTTNVVEKDEEATETLVIIDITISEVEKINPVGGFTIETEIIEEKSVTSMLTLGESNALRQGQNYIDIMAFSMIGLREQMEYEGYLSSEIDYAISNIDVDWNEEAYEDAQNYLRLMAFSKQGLIEQLEYEGYSSSEIDYAINKVGY